MAAYQSQLPSRSSYNNNIFPANARPEEEIVPWTPPTNESLQNTLQNSLMQITCSPELSEISCEGYSKFHVLVNMTCVESTPPEAMVVAPSAPIQQDDTLTKSDIPVVIPAAAVVVASPAPAPSTKPPRPPLDIICVLDTSGSMGSDNKLENLKFAGKLNYYLLVFILFYII